LTNPRIWLQNPAEDRKSPSLRAVGACCCLGFVGAVEVGECADSVALGALARLAGPSFLAVRAVGCFAIVGEEF